MKNIELWIDYLDSRLIDIGETPIAMQVFANLNPIIGWTNSFYLARYGEDIYGQKSNHPYV